jgi:hypothetical protein
MLQRENTSLIIHQYDLMRLGWHQGECVGYRREIAGVLH